MNTQCAAYVLNRFCTSFAVKGERIRPFCTTSSRLTLHSRFVCCPARAPLLLVSLRWRILMRCHAASSAAGFRENRLACPTDTIPCPTRLRQPGKGATAQSCPQDYGSLCESDCQLAANCLIDPTLLQVSLLRLSKLIVFSERSFAAEVRVEF